MTNITIHQLEADITKLLEQRAAQNGNTIEAEIKAILQSVLIPEKTPQINLTAAIENRFAELGEFQLPEMKREPMRTVSNFDITEI
jgi:plasmid stability protein